MDEYYNGIHIIDVSKIKMSNCEKCNEFNLTYVIENNRLCGKCYDKFINKNNKKISKRKVRQKSLI